LLADLVILYHAIGVGLSKDLQWQRMNVGVASMSVYLQVFSLACHHHHVHLSLH